MRWSFNDQFIADLLLSEPVKYFDEVMKLRNLVAYFFVPPDIITGRLSITTEQVRSIKNV